MRITLDVFSGRPNPAVELGGDEAKALLESLKPARRLEEGEDDLPDTPWLGYRGLVIEATEKERSAYDLPASFRVFAGDLFGRGLAHKAQDASMERLLCAADGPFAGEDLPAPFLQRLESQIENAPAAFASKNHLRPDRPDFRSQGPADPRRAVLVNGVIAVLYDCETAPRYEPDRWNRLDVRQSNNCYAYATNYRSDTRADPGRAAGRLYTSVTPDAVRAAAMADGLIDAPDAENRCPEEGHLVALILDEPYDPHWARKDRSGFWSHKPGSWNVTDRDDNRNRIADPRTATFLSWVDPSASYRFCGFMVVPPGTRVA